MDKNVTLYALSTCIHCKNTKAFLEELLGADGFDCIYTDRLSGEERNDTLRNLRRINPEVSFPTTVVGDDHVVGFKQDKIRELLDAS